MGQNSYPKCTVCGKFKKPIGRDVHLADWHSYCHQLDFYYRTGCEGYTKPPHAVTVFPTEWAMGRRHIDHDINAEMTDVEFGQGVRDKKIEETVSIRFPTEQEERQDRIARESEAALSEFISKFSVVESNVINPRLPHFNPNEYPCKPEYYWDLRHPYTSDTMLECFDMVVVIKGIDNELEYTHYIMYFTGPIGSAVTLTNCVRDLVMINRFKHRHMHGRDRYRIRQKEGKDIGAWVKRLLQEKIEESHPQGIVKETIQ